MKLERFLGYLDHVLELTKDGYYDEDIVGLIEEIIEKAENIETEIVNWRDLTNPAPPYYDPHPYKPFWVSGTEQDVKLDYQTKTNE